MTGARQIVGRYGIKKTKPGRIVHTGRVSSANSNRKLRSERELRPRRKSRYLR